MKRFALLSLFSMFLLTACSQYIYKTIYNNIDFIIIHQIDGLFDVTDSQKADLYAKIAVHQSWHRDFVLPKYIDIIHAAQNSIKTGFTGESRKEIEGRIRLEFKRIAERLSDDAVNFLLSLSPEQIARFRKHLEEYNQKLEEKIKIPSGKRTWNRVESMTDALEIYYGNFSSDQKSEIAKLVGSIPDIEEAHISYLRQTQAIFISMLEKKADRDSLKKFLLGWATRDESFMPPDFRRLFLEQRSANMKALLIIDRTIVTPEQKAQGIDKLNDIIDLIRTIRNGKQKNSP
jgi:hypothetical protein